MTKKKAVVKELDSTGYTLIFCEDPDNFPFDGLCYKYLETREKLEKEIAFWIDRYDLPEEYDVSHLFMVVEGELPEVNMVQYKSLKIA